MENSGTFQYRDFVVKFNRTSVVGDFMGFGWAFEVLSPLDNLPIFLVVIKYNHRPYSPEQPETVLNLGKAIIQQRIDQGDYEVGGYYCYYWSENVGVVKGDCDPHTTSQIRFTQHAPSKN